MRNVTTHERTSHIALMPDQLTRVLVIAVLCAILGCTSSTPQTPAVYPGIEVLLSDSSHLIAGRRVGLLTNQTGINSHGISDVELLMDAGAELTALFSPEHGFRGVLDQPNIEHSVDSATGLPIFSLYGAVRAPTEEMLELVDVMVVDLQDIGARTYTYTAAALETLRAAAGADIHVIILDRPNPIGGEMVQGPMMNLAYSSDVGILPLPMRHGLTIGELALFGNETLGIRSNVTVVPAAGWRRGMWFDETGLPWVRPSLNMPDLESATHYPGTVLFEGTNLSVGRGTPVAFQVIGAPWLEPELIKPFMFEEQGVVTGDTIITPKSPSDGKYAELTIPALRLRVVDRSVYDPVRLAVRLLHAVAVVHADSFQIQSAAYFDRRAGSDELRRMLEAGEPPEVIFSSWNVEIDAFMRVREPFLLYH